MTSIKDKEFSTEEKDAWCIENDFPIGFFDMPVERRRKEVYLHSKRNPCPDGIIDYDIYRK